MLRVPFYKDNRIVPLGIMIFVVIVFFYHLDVEKTDLRREVQQTQLVQESFRPDESAKYRVYSNIGHESSKSDNDLSESDKTPKQAVPSPRPSLHASTHSGDHTQQQLTSDDVVLMFKTGASVLWKRVPIHLSTTFHQNRIDPNNVILYSDYPDTIASWPVLDILANSSEAVRKSENFETYQQQPDYEARQVYAEQTSVEGDGFGPAGGWRLDKYKFLPLVDHAGRTKPRAKWYIYMEDDSYIFLPNLIRHLNDFNWREPWYIGGLAWKHGDYFAHGGSGFAISRAAWEKSFGADADIVSKYEAFTEVHGCGDHVLGHVFNDYGINLGEAHGKTEFSFGFNAVPHWGAWFGRANWCKPVYSWHHTHSKDVSRFFSLEQNWDFAKGLMKYRDVYQDMIAPFLRPRVDWWDNQSAKYQIRSDALADLQPPSSVKSQDVWMKAWQSVEACEAACVAWAECVQWTFYEDLCRMDEQIFLGSGIPVGDGRRQTSLVHVSGWLKERTEKWQCEK